MTWTVLFHDDFAAEFSALAERLQDELLANALLLRDFGPALGLRQWIREGFKARQHEGVALWLGGRGVVRINGAFING